ncbi:hypothetical protein AB6806_28210 [Bosea sp. RCC_152_1]|uniref:hypothetical protein n=1 Tax=Bosea sp. RCC_152_1 TaxID=3239228 RepID=UPI0035241DF0
MNLIANMMRTKGDPKIRRSGPSSLSASDRLARNLGWLGIALGLTEVLAGRRIAQALGMRDKEALIRGYGLREIGSGILCLSVDKKTGLISRIAGDSLDIATLNRALDPRNPKRGNVALAMAAVIGIGMLDVMAAKLSMVRHERRSQPRDYSDRSGFPGGVAAARGRARETFKTPADMREIPVVP